MTQPKMPSSLIVTISSSATMAAARKDVNGP